MGTPITLPVGNIPNFGVLSYGSGTSGVVKFEELFKSKIVGRPEWDRARRVVKYVKYTLEVDGYVITTNSRPNDDTWSRIRYTLQQPGLALTYSDRGFSNFNVNTSPDGLQDVCNGPHPEILEFSPMGSRLAAHIVWKCEICLPEIGLRLGKNEGVDPGTVPTRLQSPFSQGILAFNWSSELVFQNDGYAAYVVEGELEIARVNNKRDSLEKYRAYTEPQLPAGFKPTSRSFKMDDAKRIIKFNYAFVELPRMGIPVRCTSATGTYRVSCTGKTAPALANWTATLQATYTVVPTGPRREAWMRFLGLLRCRIWSTIHAKVPGVANGGVGDFLDPIGDLAAATPGEAMPTLSGPLLNQFPQPARVPNRQRDSTYPVIRAFNVSEGLYEESKTTSFECSWTFSTTFRSVFLATGMWRRMKDCAGQNGANLRDVWVTDMAAITGFTSWYNYGFRPDSEVIITADGNTRTPPTRNDKLLQTGPTVSDRARVSAGAGLIRDGVDPDSGSHPDDNTSVPGLPSPEASWLNYQLDFITDLDPGIALHKVLPQRDDQVDTLSSIDAFSTYMESDAGQRGMNTISLSSGEDVLQRMATSTYRVAMRGFGVRLGYKVPVPGLVTFGGVAVSPAKQRVIGPRVVANYSGVPVYLTAWLIWYDVPRPPRAPQAAPPNMAEHIGDVANPPSVIAVPVSIQEDNRNASFGGPGGGRLPQTNLIG